ncbi:helix-turn-helix domain-containing protein [Polluticoccus soli]|uniref:helix-turn-helix domain-containing protein n=1 Tax=Polluticoccus soli TaxID=3034150 RepID=UPI0023E296CC|nr:helix-turn-helix transcriptional regulator [Flavipsychrobacter sp. JY13-12]
MNIGIAIRSIRRQLGITQYELAEKCNISQTSLSQIENGIKRPSNRTIKKVCEVLEIPESVIYILGMQETDVPVSRKSVYDMLFPSIKSMALQIVSSEHRQLVENYEIAV